MWGEIMNKRKAKKKGIFDIRDIYKKKNRKKLLVKINTLTLIDIVEMYLLGYGKIVVNDGFICGVE